MAILHKTGEIEMGTALDEVEKLAKQTGHVIAVARKIYEAEYDKLRDAQSTDFVTILAVRHTRARLLAMQKNRLATAANSSYELFSA
jgi:hypothetical protein